MMRFPPPLQSSLFRAHHWPVHSSELGKCYRDGCVLWGAEEGEAAARPGTASFSQELEPVAAALEPQFPRQ